jgi:hypothetical protein
MILTRQARFADQMQGTYENKHTVKSTLGTGGKNRTIKNDPAYMFKMTVRQ